MDKKQLTCIECPIGCRIEVAFDGESILSVEGNNCPRGDAYARAEVVCPRRVVTSTVKTTFDKMLSVKTQKPVKKTEIFSVMEKIKSVVVNKKVAIGDIIVKNISEDIDLVATDDLF